MMATLYRRLRALPGLLARLPDDLHRIERAMAKASKQHQDSQKALAQGVSALRAETAAHRAEADRRLHQFELQLSRLTTLVGDRAAEATFGGRVPMAIADDAVPPPAPAVAPTFGPHDDWLTLAACPGCGTAERTVVCEWNKLALLDTAPDRESWVYDYAVCHGCGILYATRRPRGNRYRYLMAHFEDVVGKNVTNPLLNPNPLTDADRAHYRALVANGVFVSLHAPVPHIPGVLRDRFDAAGHVDLIGSLLDMRRSRVLEVRSRAGTIAEGLKRLYGAEVYAMPIFESQQFVLRELYGIETSGLIDFDDFTIPFDGSFDLIACNHMFNHAVRLDRFLAAVHGALRPGGHLYLYNEIDDSEFVAGTQSMIATMNPLHLQAADDRSLVRALGASGFEPVFITGRQKRHICLVRKVERPVWTPIGSGERRKRISSYQLSRDRSVLRVADELRPRFSAVWPSTVERAVASGVAVFDPSGALKVVKSS